MLKLFHSSCLQSLKMLSFKNLVTNKFRVYWSEMSFKRNNHLKMWMVANGRRLFICLFVCSGHLWYSLVILLYSNFQTLALIPEVVFPEPWFKMAIWLYLFAESQIVLKLALFLITYECLANHLECNRNYLKEN